MKRTSAQILMAIATFLTVTGLYAQDGQKPAYLNPDLPASHRAEDLVRRMTVEEKVTQLVNQSRAIPRLNVPGTTGGARPRTASPQGALPKNPIKAGDPLVMDVTVTNTGKREGDEVTQVYLSFPTVAGAPLRALRAF